MSLIRVFIYVWLIIFVLTLPAMPRLLYGTAVPLAIFAFQLAFVTIGSLIIVVIYAKRGGA